MTEPDNTRTLLRLDRETIRQLISKRSFGVLSTVSNSGHPHAAGVLYATVDDVLYINTIDTSRKARNIATSAKAAMVVPIRRVPIGGPPSAVQFQSTAGLLAPCEQEIVELVERGALKAITGHGELERPGSCFVRLPLPARLPTYGLGMPLLDLIRHPLDAAGLASPVGATRAYA